MSAPESPTPVGKSQSSTFNLDDYSIHISRLKVDSDGGRFQFGTASDSDFVLPPSQLNVLSPVPSIDPGPEDFTINMGEYMKDVNVRAPKLSPCDPTKYEPRRTSSSESAPQNQQPPPWSPPGSPMETLIVTPTYAPAPSNPSNSTPIPTSPPAQAIVDSTESAASSLREEMAKLQELLAQAHEQNRTLGHQKRLADERAEQITKHNDDLRRENEALRKHDEILEKDIEMQISIAETSQSRISALEKEISMKDGQIYELRGALSGNKQEIQSQARELDELRNFALSGNEELDAQNKELQAELSSLIRQSERLQSKVKENDSLNQNIVVLEDENRSLKAELEKSKRTRSASRSRVEELEHKFSSIRIQMTDAESVTDRLKESLVSMEEENRTFKARNAALEGDFGRMKEKAEKVVKARDGLLKDHELEIERLKNEAEKWQNETEKWLNETEKWKEEAYQRGQVVLKLVGKQEVGIAKGEGRRMKGGAKADAIGYRYVDGRPSGTKD